MDVESEDCEWTFKECTLRKLFVSQEGSCLGRRFHRTSVTLGERERQGLRLGNLVRKAKEKENKKKIWKVGTAVQVWHKASSGLLPGKGWSHSARDHRGTNANWNPLIWSFTGGRIRQLVSPSSSLLVIVPEGKHRVANALLIVKAKRTRVPTTTQHHCTVGFRVGGQMCTSDGYCHRATEFNEVHHTRTPVLE